MAIQTLTFIFVGVTFVLYIGIAIWSRAGSTNEFYIAGGGVHPIANGMATAADWMSAASFISMAGIIAFAGMDGSVYLMGWTGGYVLLALLLAPHAALVVREDGALLRVSEVRPPICAPNGYQGNPRPLSPPRHAVSGPPAPPCVSPRSPRGPDRWQPPQVELIGQAARGKGGGPAGSVPQPAVVKRAEEKRAPPRGTGF